MLTTLHILASIIGTAVILWIFLSVTVELLRSAYWAVWTLFPVARASKGKMTFLDGVSFLWHTFIDEFTGGFRYERNSCRYYSHGYWPWEPKTWCDAKLEAT